MACRALPFLVALAILAVGCGGRSHLASAEGTSDAGGLPAADASTDASPHPTPCEPCERAWLWENPRPQGNALNDVWAHSPDESWAVGEAGTVLRWDGESWCHECAPTDADLHGAWASGPEDVWAVGESGTVLHRDGAAWSIVPIPQTWDLRDVGGTSHDDVWVVGDGVLHWDGAAWSTAPRDDPLEAVVVLDTDDAWAVGGGGTIARWDGDAWTPHAAPAAKLTGVWASAADDAWATASQLEGSFLMGGLMLRWDGVTWTPARDGGALESFEEIQFFGVWGASRSDVWAVGSDLAASPPGFIDHWDGVQWTTLAESTDGLLAVAGSRPDDAWAVGTAGATLHWGGTSWERRSTGPTDRLTDVWGTGPDDVWAYGSHGSRWDDSLDAWRREAAILHRDAGRWSLVWSPEAASIDGMWGSASDDVWALSQERIHRWDGSSWSESADARGRAIWGSSRDDVWALGDDGEPLFHWNGEIWSEVPNPSEESMLAAWGRSADDVWGVGHWGAAAHFDGADWTPFDTGAGHLYGVWGDESDVWAVGHSGVIVRWDGSDWAREPSPTRSELRDVFVDAQGDLWVVSDHDPEERGAIWRREGDTWHLEPRVTRNDLWGIWGSAAGDLWVVGDGGTILSRRSSP